MPKSQLKSKAKRPINAFMLYRRANREELSRKYDVSHWKDISKYAAKEWALEPENVKMRYREIALVDQNRYRREVIASEFSSGVYYWEPACAQGQMGMLDANQIVRPLTPESSSSAVSISSPEPCEYMPLQNNMIPTVYTPPLTMQQAWSSCSFSCTPICPIVDEVSDAWLPNRCPLDLCASDARMLPDPFSDALIDLFFTMDGPYFN